MLSPAGSFSLSLAVPRTPIAGLIRFRLTNISAAERISVPALALVVVDTTRQIHPDHRIGWTMLLSLLLAGKDSERSRRRARVCRCADREAQNDEQDTPHQSFSRMPRNRGITDKLVPSNVMAPLAVAVVAAHSMTTRASARICVGNEDDDYEDHHPKDCKDPSASFHPELLPAVHCRGAFLSSPPLSVLQIRRWVLSDPPA